MAKKSYYSNADAFAKKSNFSPDHSEFYPWSKNHNTKNPNVYHKDDRRLSNQESSRPEIELHETSGATFIRVKTQKELLDELTSNAWSNYRQPPHKKKELIDVMLIDEYDQDLLPHRWSMKSTNMIEQYQPWRPHANRRMKSSAKAKNAKNKNHYRTWQNEEFKSIKQLEQQDYNDAFDLFADIYWPQRKELPILSVITWKELDTARLRSDEDDNKKAA